MIDILLMNCNYQLLDTFHDIIIVIKNLQTRNKMMRVLYIYIITLYVFEYCYIS
jgi:hypothetical protein